MNGSPQAESIAGAAGAPSPLLLLLRVNALVLWRRFTALRGQSRLLTSVVGAFVLGYLGVSFWLFYGGLRFVLRFPGMGLLLVERLLFLLFAMLFILLLLSNLIVSYSNLFRNRETHFLLTLPVSTDTIFQWKLIESSLVASWAFLFLIAPMVVAYGLTRGVPWHFYLGMPALVGMFIALPAILGSFLAVNLARYLDRRAFQVLVSLALLALIGWLVYWLGFKDDSGVPGSDHVGTVLDKMLAKTRFAEFPFLPSYWLSSSLLAWQDGLWAVVGFFALTLLSYVAFFGMLAATRVGGLFYSALSAVHSRGGVFDRWGKAGAELAEPARARDGAPGIAERLAKWLPGLPSDVRALLVKDLRMFWRDTTQWAQSLMLFGLLGVYIFNLPHFTLQLSHPFWVQLVSYLNLGACALNLATLTTRFVFPQFSLEGKRVWIVGLAPLGLERVVRAKFWLAASSSLVVTLGLIVLSCYMLDLPAIRTAYFAVAITAMTLTLNGLAVGLGVLYPNFKEDNPSKIVSGFGGTFCLVLSFLYILGSVALLALGAPWSLNNAADKVRALTCLAGFAAISLGLGAGPMTLALRRVRTMEI